MKRKGMKPIPNWLKKIVFERDGYRCIAYGKEHSAEEPLDPHHLLGRRSHPEFFYEPDDIISLCRICHNEFENNPDFKHELVNRYKLNERVEAMNERWLRSQGRWN